ncbi:MAG: glycosyltransferase, partial [Synechococcales cyanobacterium T60_A2020_003]|nr:glycosyltransferase [Synechococcales cyanobacterium T60_A2020_003]
MQQALWLGVWTLIGAGLRFTNLSEKPPWTDEFATFVFSLGHSFRTVPLDQVISLETLLEPVRVLPGTSTSAVVENLLSESNHPPLYFVLTHWWLHLFPSHDSWISVTVARSLAAVFGIALIPAMLSLGRFAFRAWRVAHLAALLIALSPFAIYLSQEARHYTLPMLWIVAALACLLQAGRSLVADHPISYKLVLLWTLIHALGIATHYFFTLTIGAEAIALLTILWLYRSDPAISKQHLSQNLRRIGWVALGILASGLVWLPAFQTSQSSELTRWIYTSDREGLDWLTPLSQLIAGLITQLYLLPIQSDRPMIVIAAAVGLALLTLGTIPLLWRGWRNWRTDPEANLVLTLLTSFVLGAIALFLLITYGAGMDLTSAFRYNFVYFPGVILLIAAGIAGHWPPSPTPPLP